MKHVPTLLLLLALGTGLGGCGSSNASAGGVSAGGSTSSAGTSGSSGTAGGDAGAPPDAGLPACATMPFAAACDASATTQPASGDYGSTGPYINAVTVETLPNPHASAPGPVTVYRPTGLSSLPVLFFSHAYGATDAGSYDALFRMLASNGYAVVHVPYPNSPNVQQKNADRYDCLWDGFITAATQYATTFDLTRVGFFGHSFGGGATPEMARRGFVEKGWGSAGRFMFIMAPWYSWGAGYDTLPTDVRTVIEVYADDDKNDHQIAVSDIWNKLPSGIERGWLMLRTDGCQCGLNAPHVVPMTAVTILPNPEDVLNGYDTWGVWRRIHALARYAFEGDMAARDVAYGVDAAMGDWVGCGGRPVRPMEGSATTPITDTCQAFMFLESKRCDYADPGAGATTGCP